MIKNIYLHVGLHKTGTSTIQQSFGEIRQHLTEYGFLYPVIVLPERDHFNYSIPFVSMFSSDPLKYRRNIRMGITTKEAVEKMNQNYDRQLRDQIQNFSGHTLIISGEGISGLSIPELERLRDYLTSITNSQVEIKILMVIRHPVKWAESRLQEQVKSGYSLQSVLPTTTHIGEHQFIFQSNKFKKVFGDDRIEIQRYEDLVKNNLGLFAGFAERFKILSTPLQPKDNKRINQAITHESATLLSAVYENFPFFENSDLAHLFRKFNPMLLIKMPGVRFQLAEDICLAVWEKYSSKINALCRSYNLTEYTYHADIVDNDKEKWGEQATYYLAGIIEKLPAEIVPVLLRALLSEIKKYSKIWPLRKKLHIFALLMFYSKYFKTNSLPRKAKIIIRNTGFFNGLILMTGYFIFKSRLIKPFVNLLIDPSEKRNG